MKNIFFLITCLSIFLACTEDQLYCGVEDPAEDLPWLKKQIEVYDTISSKDIEVYKATYEGQEGIFVSTFSSQYSHLYESYYNCEGEVVIMDSQAGGYQNPDSMDIITYKELLWHN